MWPYTVHKFYRVGKFKVPDRIVLGIFLVVMSAGLVTFCALKNRIPGVILILATIFFGFYATIVGPETEIFVMREKR